MAGLKDKIFHIDTEVNFDKFSAPSADFKIRSFGYDVEGGTLHADVLFIVEGGTYAEDIAIDYDGDAAFTDLITGLVLAYKESITEKTKAK